MESKLLDSRAEFLVNNHIIGITGEEFANKMIELINTITDKRDYYRNKVEEYDGLGIN